ncbi:MAG: hypothetical protein HKO03_12480 [Acidimicrobiia bacterium]|nr:hypothetical protein [Acidimicrobiia bacterium]
MLETVIVVSLFAALLFAGSTSSEPAYDVRISDSPTHLPCPWCLAPTQEQDAHCAACGQDFG